MTAGEWLRGGGWLLFIFILGGAALVAVSIPTERHPAVRMGGTTLGGIAVSCGIALLSFFVLGVASLFLLYPVVIALSVLVWRTLRKHPFVRVLQWRR